MLNTKRSVAICIVIAIAMVFWVFKEIENERNKSLSEVVDEIINSSPSSIPPSLTILINFGIINEQVECLLADISSSENNLKSKENSDDILGKLFKGKTHICAVWKTVNNYNNKVSREIIEGGKMINEGYLFYAYKINRVDSQKEQRAYEVGLFQNIEDCQNAEKVFLKYDYATKPCREWNPRTLSPAPY
ncbi:MAG: hypothetical protein IH886_04445 [Nitrospinae bacterium]|nr:hypothetical protein [Nitrospinota bacterium]